MKKNPLRPSTTGQLHGAKLNLICETDGVFPRGCWWMWVQRFPEETLRVAGHVRYVGPRHSSRAPEQNRKRYPRICWKVACWALGRVTFGKPGLVPSPRSFPRLGQAVAALFKGNKVQGKTSSLHPRAERVVGRSSESSGRRWEPFRWWKHFQGCTTIRDH